jgi:hypothetical protein
MVVSIEHDNEFVHTVAFSKEISPNREYISALFYILKVSI